MSLISAGSISLNSTLNSFCSGKQVLLLNYLCGLSTETFPHLCRGSCFFGYTAENSHHLKARIISKDSLFQEEKIPARKRGRCQVNSEKSSKNEFLCLGKSLAESYTPPPTPPRLESVEFTRGENAISGRGRGIHQPNWDAEKREGGRK